MSRRGASLCFHYHEDFLSAEQNEVLDEFLRSVPVVSADEQDLGATFAFAPARWSGVEIPRRKTAAAGDPIWLGEGPGPGTDLPSLLVGLRDEVAAKINDDAAAGECNLGQVLIGEMTSVYVDWYEPGGELAPHTDRSCYGPVIAGVSVGRGSAVVRFSTDGGSHGEEIVVEPRSLYFFHGPIRYKPWVHHITVPGASRFGVTFRSRSARTSGADHSSPQIGTPS